MALSDPEGILATPLTIINRKDETGDIEAILDIIRENQVTRIIVGLPLLFDGRSGEQADKVKAFTEILGERSPVPSIFHDERLSTVEAQRLSREAGIRKRVKKVRYDDLAAALILQGYLDEKRP